MAAYVACYLGILCIPVASAVGTLVAVDGSGAFSPSASIDKTLLDSRVNSMREIHQALATPVALPEPLPPLTVKPAHALMKSPAETSRKVAHRLPREAREAFASTAWSEPQVAAAPDAAPSQPAAVQFDRHTSNY